MYGCRYTLRNGDKCFIAYRFAMTLDKMKILLVAINAKYIHTNPAAYLLRANAGEFRDQIIIKEFTINQQPDEILWEIVKEAPDFIGFSTYIWNIDMVKKLLPECNKILHEVYLWLGGPEAEASADKLLTDFSSLSGIMFGEGEAVLPFLLRHYKVQEAKEQLSNIPGIIFRKNNQASLESDNSFEIIRTKAASPLSMNELCFPYDDDELKKLSGKILYYESSRGCPFHCSYCLSSQDNRVRFRSIDKVKEDLKFFLLAKIPQVKFVDRTFNCNHERTEEFLRFLLEHDNQVTNFHFEISAELLTETELSFLQKLRPGAVQLEIGVQTTNPQVLENIGRKCQLEKLFTNIKRLMDSQKQHIHLDLIAGLPGESLQSFMKSFDEVYLLHPHQLQLGFLKVLGNTMLFTDAKRFGIQYRDYPPYEVLSTSSISYEELQLLKRVEEVVEIFYNSGQFSMLLLFAEHQKEFSPFLFYQGLSDFYFRSFPQGRQSSRMDRYELLLEYLMNLFGRRNKLEEQTIIELAVFDCYARERKKARPSFSNQNEGEALAKKWTKENKTDFFYQHQHHAELFTIDIKKTVEIGSTVPKNNLAIFDYEKRSPITKNATVHFYDFEEDFSNTSL